MIHLNENVRHYHQRIFQLKKRREILKRYYFPFKYIRKSTAGCTLIWNYCKETYTPYKYWQENGLSKDSDKTLNFAGFFFFKVEVCIIYMLLCRGESFAMVLWLKKNMFIVHVVQIVLTNDKNTLLQVPIPLQQKSPVWFIETYRNSGCIDRPLTEVCHSNPWNKKLHWSNRLVTDRSFHVVLWNKEAKMRSDYALLRRRLKYALSNSIAYSKFTAVVVKFENFQFVTTCSHCLLYCQLTLYTIAYFSLNVSAIG